MVVLGDGAFKRWGLEVVGSKVSEGITEFSGTLARSPSLSLDSPLIMRSILLYALSLCCHLS